MAKIGAFLDMGLEKDLLLPFKEQTHPVRKGENVWYVSMQTRATELAATMKVWVPFVTRCAIDIGLIPKKDVWKVPRRRYC